MNRYRGRRRRDDGLSSHQRHSAMRCVATHVVECRQEDCYLDERISVNHRSIRIGRLTHSALMIKAVLLLPSSAATDGSAIFGSTATSDEFAGDATASFSSAGSGSWEVSPRPEPACASAIEPMVGDTCFSRADIVSLAGCTRSLVFYSICRDLSIKR